jgi:DnaK suppressor protein|nr:MAG: RNA polymerase-binding protein DksA [Bacteroidota bacterium]
METPPKSPYSPEELEYFRQIILEKMRQVQADIQYLEEQIRDNLENRNGEGRLAPSMEEITGNPDSDLEQAYLLHDREVKFLRYLERALLRIQEGTYGVCRQCGRPIPKERLEIVPHTTICIECKRKQG